MIEELIDKIWENPDAGNLAKERAQAILEHLKIFSCQDNLIGIRASRDKNFPVSDPIDFIWGLVDSLSLFIPNVVEVNNCLDLWGKHLRLLKELRELIDMMQQRGMVSGKYDPDNCVGDTWPGYLLKTYRQVNRIFGMIKYPAKADPKAAREGLIRTFLKYSPSETPNVLIADKILILLKDIAELPLSNLPTRSTLRQQIAKMRKDLP